MNAIEELDLQIANLNLQKQMQANNYAIAQGRVNKQIAHLQAQKAALLNPPQVEEQPTE